MVLPSYFNVFCKFLMNFRFLNVVSPIFQLRFFPLKLFYMPPPSWIQLYDSHKNVSLSHFHLFVCLTFCLFLLLLLYLLFLILCSLIVFFRICCMFRILHLQQLRLSVCLIVFLFHFLVACLSDGLLFIFITRVFVSPSAFLSS